MNRPNVATSQPSDYPPVLVIETSPGRRVRHSCGGTLYRTSLRGIRWCDGCQGWIPWEGETGSLGSRTIFTPTEQAAIDEETCGVCGLPYIDHDGTEEHRFQRRG